MSVDARGGIRNHGLADQVFDFLNLRLVDVNRNDFMALITKVSSQVESEVAYADYCKLFHTFTSTWLDVGPQRSRPVDGERKTMALS